MHTEDNISCNALYLGLHISFCKNVWGELDMHGWISICDRYKKCKCSYAMLLHWQHITFLITEWFQPSCLDFQDSSSSTSTPLTLTSSFVPNSSVPCCILIETHPTKQVLQNIMFLAAETIVSVLMTTKSTYQTISNILLF
jgi:hypothetical protein